MNPFLLAVLLASIVPRTLSQSTGQSLISSTLPSCAQQCANLLQAQTACTAPPNPAPGGTYGTQCFCGFAPLSSLKADAPANICVSCSTVDNAAIQSWYKSTCGLGGGSTTAANGQATSTSNPSRTSSTSAKPGATNQGTTVSGHPADALNVAQKDWSVVFID
ncbi:MAG: hypothetical protein Q9220_000336 [cf. Caloplaca sp. 1 TL-2023]